MRLIDAERLKADVFKASMDEHFMPMKLLDCDTVTEMIDTAPTIEERKTGKWEEKYMTEEEWIRGAPSKVCPFCHNVNRNGRTPYCPHCGEKMEADE